MQRRRFAVSAGLLTSALLLSAVPTLAAPGDCRVIRAATATTPEVSVCRQDVWLHASTSRVANAAGSGQVALPSWNTSAPTAARGPGSGAVYVAERHIDIASARHPAGRPTFQGTYTGVLDNIAIQLFITSPAYQQLGVAQVNFHRLEVDGQVVWENAATADPEIPLPITRSTDEVGHIDYAFTDLYAALADLGIENSPTTQHTIKFSTINKYHGDGNFIVQFDASDVPSGLVFNRETNAKGRLPGFVEIDTH